MQTVEHIISEVDAGSNQNAFWEAVQQGKIAETRRILHTSDDPKVLLSHCDSAGRTVLHHLAEQGKVTLLGVIITFIENKRLGLVGYLNKIDLKRNTVLHVAIQARQTETASIVINKGASLGVLNQEQKSALIMAAITDNDTLVSLIVNKLIDTGQEEILEPISRDFGSALYLACYCGTSRAVSALLMGLKQKGDSYLTNYLNKRDLLGDTALLTAASQGHLEVVRLLITAGADKSVLNNSNFGVVAYSIYSGNTQLLHYLVGLGINCEITCGTQNVTMMAFAEVCQENKTKNRNKVVVNYTPMIALIKHISDLMALSRGDHLLSELSVRELLEGGASLNQTSALGETPLHLAVSYRVSYMVKSLLTVGADIHARDHSGATVIDYVRKMKSELDFTQAMLLSLKSSASLASAVSLIETFSEKLKTKAYFLLGSTVLSEIYPQSENKTFWANQAYKLFSKVDINSTKFHEAQYQMGKLLYLRSDIILEVESLDLSPPCTSDPRSLVNTSETDLKINLELSHTVDNKNLRARMTAAYAHFVAANDFSKAADFRIKISEWLSEPSRQKAEKSSYDFHNPEDQLTVVKQIKMLQQRYLSLQQKTQERKLAYENAVAERRDMEAQALQATQALKSAFSNSPTSSSRPYSPATPPIASPLRLSNASSAMDSSSLPASQALWTPALDAQLESSSTTTLAQSESPETHKGKREREDVNKKQKMNKPQKSSCHKKLRFQNI